MTNKQVHTIPTLSVCSDMHLDHLHECLEEGNRRGKLPEVTWIDDLTFNLVLPSRPLLTTLKGTISKSKINNCKYNINFSLKVQRFMLYIFILITILSLVVGLPVSILIWPWMKIWWISASIIISSVISILWMWFRWPDKSLADAESLLPDWLDVIRSRLE